MFHIFPLFISGFVTFLMAVTKHGRQTELNADLLILAQLVKGFSLPRWERVRQYRAGHIVALQEARRKRDAGSRLPPFILSWCPAHGMAPPYLQGESSSLTQSLHKRPELCLTNLQRDSKSSPVKNGLQRKSSLITNNGWLPSTYSSSGRD